MMLELEDNEFDKIFKNRIIEKDFDFEEESWLKMENKLRARERKIFWRNVAMAAAVLLMIGTIFFNQHSIKNHEEQQYTQKNPSLNKSELEPRNNLPQVKHLPSISITTKESTESLPNQEKNTAVAYLPINKHQQRQDSSTLAIEHPDNAKPNTDISPEAIIIENTASAIAKLNTTLNTSKIDTPKKNKSYQPKIFGPLTLSLIAGPDFSSTEKNLGGKGGAALGFGISVGLGKRWNLGTGLIYAVKNYAAQGYDYSFSNPNVANIISAIDAKCQVIEVPITAGFSLLENDNRKITLNGGISSYFMLKENYRFIYTEASKRADRFLEKTNANQHYLSVIDLSAAYNLKLNGKGLSLGIQPYLKIPLKGIGEGKVPLNSSGISLNLNYAIKTQH